MLLPPTHTCVTLSGHDARLAGEHPVRPRNARPSTKRRRRV
jgi:hypothetical protein